MVLIIATVWDGSFCVGAGKFSLTIWQGWNIFTRGFIICDKYLDNIFNFRSNPSMIHVKATSIR